MPEQRIRYVFSNFGIPMFYAYMFFMYICYQHAMSISHMALIVAM